MTKVFSSLSSLNYLIPGLTRNLMGFGRFLPFLSLGKPFLESGERRFGNRQYPYTLIPGLTRNLMGFGRFLLSQERGVWEQERGVSKQERGVSKQERGELDSRPEKGNSSSPTPFPQITSWQLHPPHDTIIPHDHAVRQRYDIAQNPNWKPA